MTKGTALFDTVAISGTETQVRAGQGGCAVRADVGGRGAGPFAIGVNCAGCAQFFGLGGVVRMDDGAVTFRGGSISNSTAVRAPSASGASRVVEWHVARCGTADGWRARCGARMLRHVVHSIRRMRPEWSV